MLARFREVVVKVIGLTGGIASGKSTVAQHLQERGLVVLDADRLGHQAYLPDTPAYRKVVETFGSEVIAEDRSIDRRVLGSKVFGDPDALKRLTDIVWPEIKNLARDQISQIAGKSPDAIVALEAAVLLEAEWQDLVDEIWVVAVDRKTAIARATARDGSTAEAIEARLDAQISNEERIAAADVCIYNNEAEHVLRDQVDSELKKLQQRVAT